MRKYEGEAFDRRAIWNATGIIIASADVLDEDGENRDGRHENNDLTLHGGHAGRDPMEECLYDTTALNRGAYDQRARYNDDNVVPEAGERCLVRHDAGENCGEQRENCNEVVAKPSPYESDHQADQNGEGESLSLCHGYSPDQLFQMADPFYSPARANVGITYQVHSTARHPERPSRMLSSFVERMRA
jgi:hypothetical protein